MNSAGGAFSGQVGTSSAITIYGCLRFVQICARGTNVSASSSDPARTTAMPGRAVLVFHSRV